jgi:Spy/CpxP family protein refolding chaperone
MKAAWYLALGAVAGILACASPAAAHEREGDWGRHGAMHRGMGCDSRRLSPEKEKMVRDAMHRAMEKNKPLWQEMRGVHERMRHIMMAEKFNAKAFRATAHRMMRLQDRMQENRLTAAASVAGKLTPHERMAAAKMWMMHPGMGHPGMMHPEMGHPGFDHDGGPGPRDMHTQPMHRYHEDDYGNLNN